MTGAAMLTSPEQQRALERFYYREARLLDNRQYQQWLATNPKTPLPIAQRNLGAKIDNLPPVAHQEDRDHQGAEVVLLAWRAANQHQAAPIGDIVGVEEA